MNDALDTWFRREILVHEAALMRFLRRHWHDHDEVRDLRQDVYIRVYKAAERKRPASPKSFLFATARNLMVDMIRRQRIVSITAVGDLEQLYVLKDERGPDRWLSGRERLRQLAQALDQLPDRCREVVWLRRVQALSQKEIARRLGISEKTVEKHITKGLRLIAEHLHGASQDGVADAPAQAEDARTQHRE